MASYRGIDVFLTPADEVVSRISRDAPFDPEHPEPGHTYIFPRLDLSLWRPTRPGTAEGEAGRGFSTIGVGIPGYYGGRA